MLAKCFLIDATGKGCPLDYVTQHLHDLSLCRTLLLLFLALVQLRNDCGQLCNSNSNCTHSPDLVRVMISLHCC